MQRMEEPLAGDFWPFSPNHTPTVCSALCCPEEMPVWMTDSVLVTDTKTWPSSYRKDSCQFWLLWFELSRNRKSTKIFWEALVLSNIVYFKHKSSFLNILPFRLFSPKLWFILIPWVERVCGINERSQQITEGTIKNEWIATEQEVHPGQRHPCWPLSYFSKSAYILGSLQQTVAMRQVS